MNEANFGEIEKALLFISEARKRTERAAKELRRRDADEHLTIALEEAERELEVVGRRLMQQTYFAVPEEQLTIEAPAEELTLS